MSTVSQGVLASGLIHFTPQLPEWKAKAFHSLEMCIYCKMLMSFEEKFWAGENLFMIASETKGRYNEWICVGENVLMCIVVGDEAKRVENMEDEAIKDEV